MTKKKTVAESALDKLPASKVSKKSKAAPKELPEEVPGWELLKPFDEVPVWDQAPLLEFVEEITSDSRVDYSGWSKAALQAEVDKRNAEYAEENKIADEDEQIDLLEIEGSVNKGKLIVALKADHATNGTRADISMTVIGQLAKSLLPYAIDEAEYTKFVSGSKGLQNAARLGMAWVGQMGGSSSSDD